jgi:hypothetical protein
MLARFRGNEAMREAPMTAHASRQAAIWVFTCASFAFIGAVILGVV